MQGLQVFVLFLCVFYVAANTEIRKCSHDKKTPEDYKLTVSITDCTTPPCNLRKGSSIDGEFKFTPDRPAKTLTNSIFAHVGSIKFPFLGVDGTTACDKLYKSDGKTKVSCPLEANTEYIYKVTHPVAKIYPEISMNIEWGLTSEDNTYIFCFEILAKITK